MSEAGLSFRLRGVYKCFKKGSNPVEVLTGVDLEIGAGESLTILGASGVGKSTLLHVIGGLERPDQGEVLLDGKSVWQQNEAALADFRNQFMGFVFQFHHLLKDFSAAENVAMPLAIRGISHRKALLKARQLLEEVGLGERLNHRPGELSGGEQQRVAIARAMAGDPRVLLADEPTGNLDGSTAEQIHDLILNLNRERGCTLIIVTHNASIAKMTTNKVWLHEGKIFSSAPTV